MSRRPAFLAVDLVGALHIVGTLIAYLSLATLVPAAVALGYGEPVWPFLAVGCTRGRDRRRGRAGDARRPPAQRPRGLPRRLADVARRRRARRAAVHLLGRPSGQPARRCVFRGDVRLQHDRRQHRRERRGAASRPRDVAPVLAMARRNRDHRARARRPAPAARRRPAAARARDAGARDRVADHAHPRHRPPGLDPLHRAHRRPPRDLPRRSGRPASTRR